MSRRQLYKHSFKTNWCERRYNDSSLHNRRYYRAFQKEMKKKNGIDTVMFSAIDEAQLKWQNRLDKKQKELDRIAERDVEFNPFK